MTQAGCTATLTTPLVKHDPTLYLSLSLYLTHTHVRGEIKVSIPLYMCNDVMNYGYPAPLSVVKVEKAMQCELINVCHI